MCNTYAVAQISIVTLKAPGYNLTSTYFSLETFLLPNTPGRKQRRMQGKRKGGTDAKKEYGASTGQREYWKKKGKRKKHFKQKEKVKLKKISHYHQSSMVTSVCLT